MFKKLNLITNIKFGLLAAVAFAIPVFIYIRDSSYASSWLLYLGSALFAVVIAIYTLFFNKTRDENANTAQMVFASHVTVVIGIILSVLFCFILLSVFVPGYLGGPADPGISADAPTNTVHGKANGLGFRVFVGAILINFFFGAFAGLLFPFSAKRDQTKNAGDKPRIHQEGAA